MTCIVAIAEGGTVYMGGDSAGVSHLSLEIRKNPKVFKNKDFVIGYTTSFRMGQLLQYAFTPPKRHPDEDLFEYMVTSFVDGVRETLKKGGFASKEDEVERGGNFIVGIEGRIFQIESDYQVSEIRDNFASCGCGYEIALGALYATEGEDQRPKDRLRVALEAAEHFSAGVRGPFSFIET